MFLSSEPQILDTVDPQYPFISQMKMVSQAPLDWLCLVRGVGCWCLFPYSCCRCVVSPNSSLQLVSTVCESFLCSNIILLFAVVSPMFECVFAWIYHLLFCDSLVLWPVLMWVVFVLYVSWRVTWPSSYFYSLKYSCMLLVLHQFICGLVPMW